ncbi:MAG: dihydrolipoyl dehydrogenase [Chlamydiae bacterium]|nr:dihydrolipoyl dehydrogenase [Chlamydiota bacterium]
MESFDVVIIGAGPAGYVAAIRAAQLGLKVACVDKRSELGGTCLNVGCIPSKALLHASQTYYQVKKEGKQIGIRSEGLSYDFPSMMGRKKEVVASLQKGILGLFKKNKVTHLIGSATFRSEREIAVKNGSHEQTFTATHFVIATGSEPTPLPFIPFDEKKILSSTGALQLDKVPEKMIVVGAGVIGVELGSVYARLGSHVCFVEFMDRVCPTLDGSLSKGLQQSLQRQGMEFHLSAKVMGIEVTDRGALVKVATSVGGSIELFGDVVLAAIGRRPFTQDLGLFSLGIELTAKGLIPVDGLFRTKLPHIYAIGDVIDGPMLAHKASEEGVCVAEIIANAIGHIDYASLPNVVYTHPEVASTGLTEEEAKAQGFNVLSGSYSFMNNPRGKCTQEEEGFVKVLVDAHTDKVLGIHILGAHASEMIATGVMAIEKRLTAKELSSLCFAHPTLSEAIKEATLAVYKRAIHQ